MYDVKLPKDKDIIPFIDWCSEYVGPHRYSRTSVAGVGWEFLEIVKTYKHMYVRFSNAEDATAFMLKFEL